MRSEADCVIVGGGIGGAVLALTLGQRGHRVIVLERELQPPGMGRPEVLARSTMEVFQRLGAGTRMMQEAALPLCGLELWQSGGTRLFSLSRGDFLRAGAQPYSTDPARTRRILLEQAEATASVEIQRGVEVRELIRDGSRGIGVRAVQGQTPLSVKAHLVVGDDGGHSRIRESLHIPLTTQAFPLDFVTAAGPALPSQPEALGQAWVNPCAIRTGIFGGIFMPLPNSRVAMVFLMRPGVYERFRQGDPRIFYDAAAHLSPLCTDLARTYKFPDGFTHLQRPFGHAPRYVADGAALMGDAAHPVSPAGGQGANMSVADAVILAEVAHDALVRGDCSAARLQLYERNRRPANTRSLQLSVRTTAVLRLLRTLPWLAPILPRLLAWAERGSETKDRLIRTVSQSFTSPMLSNWNS